MRAPQPSPDGPELAAAKAAVRADARRRRAAVPADVRATASRDVGRHLEQLVDEVAAGRIGVYAATAAEVDVDAAARAWLDAGLVVAYPRVTGAASMTLQAVQEVPAQVSGSFGIREPDGGPAVDVDVLVVPGLAFDRRGGRLGYGRGFYDRFLAACASRGRRPLAVGVCLEVQLVTRVPQGLTDVAVDAVVTEADVYR